MERVQYGVYKSCEVLSWEEPEKAAEVYGLGFTRAILRIQLEELLCHIHAGIHLQDNPAKKLYHNPENLEDEERIDTVWEWMRGHLLQEVEEETEERETLVELMMKATMIGKGIVKFKEIKEDKIKAIRELEAPVFQEVDQNTLK